MPDEPSVTVIVLNWNGRELLKDCLGSLEKVEYENFNVLVVDNGSMDDSVEYVKLSFPNFDILELDNNLGFAAGNNLGFDVAKNKNAEFVIFLNNDTIVDKNFIKPLLAPFEDISVGQTVPKILYADDEEKIWYAGGIVNLWTGNIFHQGIREYDSERFNQSKITDYATGCCFCMKVSDYEGLNGFDESYSMYGEDVDLSLRIRKSGKNIFFVPESKIYHKVSASIGGAFSLKKMKRKLGGLFRIYNKHATLVQWMLVILFSPYLVLTYFIKYFRLRFFTR